MRHKILQIKSKRQLTGCVYNTGVPDEGKQTWHTTNSYNLIREEIN